MFSNNLVLGLAAGYHFGDVCPFVASLRASGFAGECVLFASETTRDIDRIAELGATVIPFTREGVLEQLPYNALRYWLYRDYLREHAGWDHILISDVRDVIFQSNPFAVAWGEGVNITLEDASMTVGSCEYMTKWTCGHLGERAWRAMADQRISCSGTTVANYDSMLRYLETIIPLLENYEPAKFMAGYDQGVHNHLLHGDKLDPITVHDNSGPILTLGYAQEPVVKEGMMKGQTTDAPFTVLNDDGKAAMLVHQYDRKPELFTRVRDWYVPKKTKDHIK